MSRGVRTSHAGSLPRTPELIAAAAARRENPADGRFEELLSSSVVDLLARQRALGIDIPNDGEYGHAMASEVDYGAWWHYVFARTGNLELSDTELWQQPAVRSEPGRIQLTSFGDRRDRGQFTEAYTDLSSGITTGPPAKFPAAVGPISYTGTAQVQRDIANVTAGLEAAGYQVSDGYLNSLGPGSGARIENHHYADEEEFIWAWADVLREEYLAITAAGLTVQIDDPSIAENWDQINPEPSVEDYRRFTRIRVEALNHALRGIPAEQVRFHTCWGSWHGPHVTDIGFAEIVDLVLEINAGGYTFEAANVRHEHEWRIWEDVKLPEGKHIIPGIVSHATNVVEHPELVADRIERFARLVGPENVVASTDCGLGGRIHPQIATAKLETLVAGTEIANHRLGTS